MTIITFHCDVCGFQTRDNKKMQFAQLVVENVYYPKQFTVCHSCFKKRPRGMFRRMIAMLGMSR